MRNANDFPPQNPRLIPRPRVTLSIYYRALRQDGESIDYSRAPRFPPLVSPEIGPRQMELFHTGNGNVPAEFARDWSK